MALQSSGPISISNIKAELGSSSNSLRALSAAAGKSTPDAMSEFYGFSSLIVPIVSSTGGGSVTGGGTAANPYVVTQTSGSFSIDSGFISPPFGNSSDTYHYMEWLDWNFNYYTGAKPGSRVKFQIKEAVSTRMYLKFTAKSISGFGTAADSFFTRATGFFSTGWGSNGPVLNDVKSGTGTLPLNYEVELRIGASHISEEYFFTDETQSDYTIVSYGGNYPTINSLTYQVWFEKV